MTKTRKTLSTAIAAAFIATAGLASIPASASAAGLARIAPVETTAPQATQVHYFGGGYYHHHIAATSAPTTSRNATGPSARSWTITATGIGSATRFAARRTTTHLLPPRALAIAGAFWF